MVYRVLMTKVDRINDNVGKSQADYWGIRADVTWIKVFVTLGVP